MDYSLMTLRLLMLITLMMPLVSGKVLANEILSAMNGNWIGNGWAKENANGQRELVRCRVKNNYINASRRLVVKGVCAVPGCKFELGGTVSSQNDTSEISGRWSNPFGIGSTSVSGQQRDNTIILTYSARLGKSKQSREHSMVWALQSSGFTLETELVGEDNIQMSKVEFTRR